MIGKCGLVLLVVFAAATTADASLTQSLPSASIEFPQVNRSAKADRLVMDHRAVVMRRGD